MSGPGKEVTNIISLHVDKGFSTSKIASMLDKKKNSVIAVLRYWKVLRSSPGRQEEELVAKHLEDKGYKIERQRGDAPFDFLCDGERVDVKSASLSLNTVSYRYVFEMIHNDSPEKNIHKSVDYFLLVFKDIPRRPIYRLNSKDVSTKKISFTKSLKSKYLIELVGYLD